MALPRQRRWTGNLISLVLALGLILCIAEVAARVALVSRRGKEGRELRSYTAFHPDLGWSKQPGARAHYIRTEYDIEIAINSLGLRDRERTIEPPPGTERILVLGDSFVEGYTVSADEMVTQVMERALDRPACRVEVLNGATAGYSTDQELIFYRQVGRCLKPGIVVLFFYYNDIVANASATGAKPMFANVNGQLHLARSPSSPAPSPPTAVPPREPPAGSAAWAWAKDRLIRGAPGTYNRLAALGLWTPVQQTRWIPDELLVYRAPYPRRVGAAWQLTELLLADLKRDATESGARFLVAYVPAVMEVRDSSWEVTRSIYGMGRKWSRDAVVRRLEDVGRRRGFDVVDLTPALREADRWWRPAYFTYDRHWTARGHRVAGETAAQAILQRGWLDCRTSH